MNATYQSMGQIAAVGKVPSDTQPYLTYRVCPVRKLAGCGPTVTVAQVVRFTPRLEAAPRSASDRGRHGSISLGQRPDELWRYIVQRDHFAFAARFVRPNDAHHLRRGGPAHQFIERR